MIPATEERTLNAATELSVVFSPISTGVRLPI